MLCTSTQRLGTVVLGAGRPCAPGTGRGTYGPRSAGFLPIPQSHRERNPTNMEL